MGLPVIKVLSKAAPSMKATVTRFLDMFDTSVGLTFYDVYEITKPDGEFLSGLQGWNEDVRTILNNGVLYHSSMPRKCTWSFGVGVTAGEWQVKAADWLVTLMLTAQTNFCSFAILWACRTLSRFRPWKIGKEARGRFLSMELCSSVLLSVGAN